jgi:hypothetical protein
MTPCPNCGCPCGERPCPAAARDDLPAVVTTAPRRVGAVTPQRAFIGALQKPPAQNNRLCRPTEPAHSRGSVANCTSDRARSCSTTAALVSHL